MLGIKECQALFALLANGNVYSQELVAIRQEWQADTARLLPGRGPEQ